MLMTEPIPKKSYRHPANFCYDFWRVARQSQRYKEGAGIVDQRVAAECQGRTNEHDAKRNKCNTDRQHPQPFRGRSTQSLRTWESVQQNGNLVLTRSGHAWVDVTTDGRQFADTIAQNSFILCRTAAR